jgi:hypothetical protein
VHERVPRKALLILGAVLAFLGGVASLLVVVRAGTPPAEGNFRWLWITMPAALAGLGVLFVAAVTRGRRASVAAALWMLSLCAVPYAWGLIRAWGEQPTDIGTLGGLLLVLLGVPGVLMLVWSLLRD